jgi:hypothetical protein
MSVDLFQAIPGAVGHCIGINVSFFVLAAFAVAMDSVLRWCERRGTNRSLLRVLHGMSLMIVWLDGAAVLLEDVIELAGHLKPLIA